MLIRVTPGATPNRTDRALAKSMDKLPGVALQGVSVARGRTVREIDAVVLTPDGLVVIEAKGTAMRGQLASSLNSDWTIDGAAADFYGGPNPLAQTRKAAQVLRQSLESVGVASGFITAVVAVSGPVRTSPHLLGDTWVSHVDDVAGVLLRMRRSIMSISTARRVLACLGIEDISDADLEQEGFTAGEEGEQGAAQANSRDRRRARRIAEMEVQAQESWKNANRRHLVFTSIGGIVSALVMVNTHPVHPAPIATSVLAAAAWQLTNRHRFAGQRTSGTLAVLGWLVTLTPWAGVAAVLTSTSTITSLTSEQKVMQANFTVLASLMLLLTMVAGKSSFIVPPPLVLERFDVHGKPTGTLVLADARPDKSGSDWRPAGDASGAKSGPSVNRQRKPA